MNVLYIGLYWQREKEVKIEEALNCDPVDIASLRSLATTLGGLVNSRLRKRVWPKLVGVSVFHIPPYQGPPLSELKDRAQVLLDVNRCGKRIPKREFIYLYVQLPTIYIIDCIPIVNLLL